MFTFTIIADKSYILIGISCFKRVSISKFEVQSLRVHIINFRSKKCVILFRIIKRGFSEFLHKLVNERKVPSFCIRQCIDGHVSGPGGSRGVVAHVSLRSFTCAINGSIQHCLAHAPEAPPRPPLHDKLAELQCGNICRVIACYVAPRSSHAPTGECIIYSTHNALT